MVWPKKKHTCGYWDCKTHIEEDEILCALHKEKWLVGLVDRCPECQRFKDVMYYRCLDCYVGRKVKKQETPTVVPEPNQKYRIEYSDEWTDGHLRADRCYIYIVGFDDGSLQVGQTTNIRERLAEFKKTRKSDRGKNPTLEYLEMAADEKSAEYRINELERIMKSNPGQIAAMTFEFHHHMRDFGFFLD